MAGRPARSSDHAFSVEVDIVRLNEAGDRLWIDGFLGELIEIGFVEHTVFEIRGVEATLRAQLKEEELRELLQEYSFTQ